MGAYCIAHGTPLNVMYQSGWEGLWRRMDTCIYKAETLCVHLKLSQRC